MRLTNVGVLLGFVSSILSAQVTFLRDYGGTATDYGAVALQTPDSGYIVVGSTASFGAGNYDLYLVKTDSLGDTLWTRTYGGAAADRGLSIQLTEDGGYVVAGYTASFGAGNRDVWLLKYNALGDTTWSRTYGGPLVDAGTSVSVTADGGFIITGYTYSFGVESCDVYLVKTDAEGDTLWTRTYGGPDCQEGRSVSVTDDGGCFITGWTGTRGPYIADVYLLRIDESGSVAWTSTLGGSYLDYGYCGIQTSDGGFIATGYTMSFGAGFYDVWLVKTDSAGDTLWTRTFGDHLNNVGCWVEQTADGGYVIAGFTDPSGQLQFDALILKTDDVGDSVWAVTYGGGPEDRLTSVQQTWDGGYVATGFTLTQGQGLFDMFLVKTDSTGGVWVGTEEPRDRPCSDRSIRLSPALAKCGTLVRVIGLDRHSKLTLLDVSGRVAHQATGDVINTSGLRPGAYFLSGSFGRAQAPAKLLLVAE